MARLKPNIIHLSGGNLSDKEFTEVCEQYEKTGCAGTISEKDYIRKMKENSSHIISYENDEM